MSNDNGLKEQGFFASVLFSNPHQGSQSSSQPRRNLEGGVTTRSRAAEQTPGQPRRLTATVSSGLSSGRSQPYERERRQENRLAHPKVPPPTVSIYDGHSAQLVPVGQRDFFGGSGLPMDNAESGDELTVGEKEERDTINRTVTVFGFTPDKVAAVLKYLDYCGKIEETWTSDALSNGMHIRFDSEMNAARALAKTGQFVDGNIMIGVVKFDPQKYQGRRQVTLPSMQLGNRENVMPLAQARDSFRIETKPPRTPYRITDHIYGAFDWLFGF